MYAYIGLTRRPQACLRCSRAQSPDAGFFQVQALRFCTGAQAFVVGEWERLPCVLVPPAVLCLGEAPLCAGTSRGGVPPCVPPAPQCCAPLRWALAAPPPSPAVGSCPVCRCPPRGVVAPSETR